MSQLRKATILFVEPFNAGHHFTYLRWLVREAAARNHRVVIATTTELINDTVLQDLVRQFRDLVALVSIPFNAGSTVVTGKTEVLINQYKQWKWFATAYRVAATAYKVDVAFIPCLDYLTYITAILGSPFSGKRWAGIIMRPPNSALYRDRSSLLRLFIKAKETLLLRLLARKDLVALFTADELFFTCFLKRYPALGFKLAVYPEPADPMRKVEKAEAKKALGLEQASHVILVYGHIDERKGTQSLFSALEGMAQDIHVVLAGRFAEHFKACRLADQNVFSLRASGRLLEIDEFVSEEDTAVLFAAADIVWLGYTGHLAPSGVLAQAGVAEIPVIACQGGMIGWITARYRTGLVVDTNDINMVRQAITQLTQDKVLYDELSKNAKERFSPYTTQTVAATIFDRLDLHI